MLLDSQLQEDDKLLWIHSNSNRAQEVDVFRFVKTGYIFCRRWEMALIHFNQYKPKQSHSQNVTSCM